MKYKQRKETDHKISFRTPLKTTAVLFLHPSNSILLLGRMMWPSEAAPPPCLMITTWVKRPPSLHMYLCLKKLIWEKNTHVVWLNVVTEHLLLAFCINSILSYLFQYSNLELNYTYMMNDIMLCYSYGIGMEIKTGRGTIFSQSRLSYIGTLAVYLYMCLPKTELRKWFIASSSNW